MDCTHTNTHTHTLRHKHTHTRMHTHAHTHAHTRTHICTHTHIICEFVMTFTEALLRADVYIAHTFHTHACTHVYMQEAESQSNVYSLHCLHETHVCKESFLDTLLKIECPTHHLHTGTNFMIINALPTITSSLALLA